MEYMIARANELMAEGYLDEADRYVQQAIDEGVITESQAKQLQENGFRGGFFGKGGLHGRGRFPFPKPAPTSGGDL